MLNIACVKWGDKFSPDYVNILYDMCRRNLPEGYKGRFVCFTDNPDGLDEGVDVEELPSGLIGYWNKLALFQEHAFEKGDRVLYLDLDTIVIGKLDDIVKYEGDFAILRDEYRGSGTFQSSIMAWEAGKYTFLWDRWVEGGRPEIIATDQAWLEQTVPQATILQDVFPDCFKSYKLHCKGFPPRGTKIVYFHGVPTPEDCNDFWVKDIWRVGGGQGFDLETVCNTEIENLATNIKSSSRRDIPWLTKQEAHDGKAVIVGGAPSLADSLGEIKARQNNGQVVFALNGVHDYLIENGIIPDVAVIVDARPENAKFISKADSSIQYYFASQCAKEVFEAAPPESTTLFHCLNPGIETLLPDNDKPILLIGGGSTVALKAIALAHVMGYRTFHCYGMDSCYDADKHHAYEQELNDGERVLNVVAAGRKFMAAGWMVQQANEFQELVANLVNEDCVFTVRGDGLIPHLIHVMAAGAAQVTMIDGEMWPTDDIEARHAIIGELDKIRHVVSYCLKTDVVVQAGGNCGLFPRELSKHFKMVYTFEPHPINFRCLQHNVKLQNVVQFQYALGQEAGTCDMSGHATNCGAYKTVPGDTIPVMRIDDLALEACDLIFLDIEGYEPFALMGGEHTIKRFKPTIVIELKGLGAGYGYPDEKIVEYLVGLGYKQAAALGQDVIFIQEN